MAANYVHSIEMGFTYKPFVEKDLVMLIAYWLIRTSASAIVTDLPRTKSSLAVLYANVVGFDVKVEVVDAAGLFPLPDSLKRIAFGQTLNDGVAFGQTFTPIRIDERPNPYPKQDATHGYEGLPNAITDQWTFTDYDELIGPIEMSLPINEHRTHCLSRWRDSWNDTTQKPWRTSKADTLSNRHAKYSV